MLSKKEKNPAPADTKVWFKLSYCEIEPVNVVSSTAKTIRIRYDKGYERSVHRSAKFESYFETFEAAQGQGIEDAEAKIAQAKSEIEYYQNKLNKLRELKAPK